MILNENTIKGKWLEIKGGIQKTWGKFTNDELDKNKGDIKVIEGLMQQRYGKTQQSYIKRLDEIFLDIRNKKSKTVHNVKKNLKKKTP